MKFPALKLVFALFLSILSTTSIAATSFDRDDFGANAIEFGFSIGNIAAAGDGNFLADTNDGTVKGVGDVNFLNEGITEPFAFAGASNQHDFTFADPVSAFGFNFAFNEDDTYIFSVADSSNNIIASATLNPTDFGSCTGTTFFVCGFIGLNVDSNQILSANFDNQTTSSFGPIIDDVIYETETVPTPGILWLFSTGFLGLYWSRKKNYS